MDGSAAWGGWEQGRPSRFDIDLDAVGRATRRVRGLVGPDVRFFATLKANAYGFGLLPVARAVLASGADALAVVEPTAAIALRRDGVTAPILVYAGGLIDEGAVRTIERHDLIPTVMTDAERETLARHATRPLKVAVKVDVGQERLGVPADRAVAFIRRVAGTPRLVLDIVNSHPVIPRDDGEAALTRQFACFRAVLDGCERDGVHVPVKLFAGSKVLNLQPGMALNAVDPGERLSDTVDGRSPFAALVTRLIHVRHDLGYGVLPLGTSDGLDRVHAGAALVRGRRGALGRINLEYARVDVSGMPDAAVGDEVVLVGEQGGERIAPEEAAAHQDCGHPSRLAMAIRSSVPRRYLGAAAVDASAAAAS